MISRMKCCPILFAEAAFAVNTDFRKRPCVLFLKSRLKIYVFIISYYICVASYNKSEAAIPFVGLIIVFNFSVKRLISLRGYLVLVSVIAITALLFYPTIFLKISFFLSPPFYDGRNYDTIVYVLYSIIIGEA